MPTTSTITHDLPEFPYSPASDARRRLSALLSSSHFVTTVVSPPAPAPHPSSAAQPPTLSCPDRQDNADPPPLTPPDNADFSSSEIAAHPPAPSPTSNPPASTQIPPIVTAREQSFKPAPNRPESCSVGIDTVRLKTSKYKHPPSQAYRFKQSPVPIRTGQECVNRRRRSAWRHCKRMGNHFVTPLRSMGLCFTSCAGGRRTVAFCENFSAHDTSPGSSWYSSDEYPPEFIRAVLENNALFGKLAVE